MLRRETFVMKLVWFSDSAGGSLKIQLHRPASGESKVFNTIEELCQFINAWGESNSPKPPVKYDDETDYP